MPRLSHPTKAAIDTLSAYYRAVAEGNLESLMKLWCDEEFVSCIRADGTYLHGIEAIRAGFARKFELMRSSIDVLDTHAYDSLGTVVYTVAEAHHTNVEPTVHMVFATYVMVHDRGTWRIAHMHASPMPEAAAIQFSGKLRPGAEPLH